MSKKKILVLGYKGSGKDTFAELLSTYCNLLYYPTSLIVCSRIIYPKTLHLFTSVEDCMRQKNKYRRLWFQILNEYSKESAKPLVSEVLSNTDIYCGLRNIEHVLDSVDLFDYIFWIERSGCYEKESMNFSLDDLYSLVPQVIVVNNNGSLEDLKAIVKTDCAELLKDEL